MLYIIIYCFALFGILQSLLSLNYICECCTSFTPAEGESVSHCLTARLESETSGMYLQSACRGGLWGERDYGYDSLRRRMSVLDRLNQTHSVWLLLTVGEEEASNILLKQPPGVRGFHPGIHMLTLKITSNCNVFYDL